MCSFDKRLTQLKSQNFNISSTRNLLTLNFIFELLVNGVEHLADLFEDLLDFAVMSLN